MKRKIVFLILLTLATATLAFGQGATAYNINAKPTADWFSSGGYKDTGWQWAKAIDRLVAAGGVQPGTGGIYYVDSAVTNEGDGSSWSNAKDTLDEAINLCTANNGDIIYVAQNHAETMGTGADVVDVDVAGVTIIGLGSEKDAPAFTYSDYDTGTFAIGAANVTIVNFEFIAGVSDVNEAIDIEAAGDNFALIGCRFPKPTTNSWEFLDAIDCADGSNDILIAGCEYYNDEAGAAPAHFIDAGNGTAGPTRLQVVGCIIKGDFSVSAIWSDEPCDEAYIAYNTIVQHTSGQHCIEFTDTGTGVIAYNALAADSAGTTLDPGSMYCIENYVSTGVDTAGVSVPASNNAADLDAILTDTSAMEQSGEYCVTKSLTSIVNGNNDLFVVANGPIKIIEIVGIVTTTAIEAKSVLINYNMDPTTPAGDTVFGTDGTALEINADAIGALYTWTGVVAADLLATDNGVALGIPAPTLIVPAGSLELAVVVATSATGQIDFFLRYKPMTPGATVTAAP